MDLQQKHNTKLNTVLLFALLTTINFSMPQYVKAKNVYTTKQKLNINWINALPTDGITMLESILKVVVDNKYETIEQVTLIKIDSGFTKSLNGCETPICLYNLSLLPNGIYKVIVDTNMRNLVGNIKLSN